MKPSKCIFHFSSASSAFATITCNKLVAPESIADFIEGRVPKKVGVRHYTKLLRQVDRNYRKYAEYLSQFRRTFE